MKQEIIEIIHKDLWDREDKCIPEYDLILIICSIGAIVLIVKDNENLTNGIMVFGVFGIMYWLIKSLAKVKFQKIKQSLIDVAKEKEKSLGLDIGVQVKHINGFQFPELQEVYLIKDYKNQAVLLESLKDNSLKQVSLKEMVKDYVRKESNIDSKKDQ